MKKRSWFTAAIFSLLFVNIFSQTPPYYHYTSYDGLPSSTVYDMLQDDNGFLWFATFNGVSRFDGKHFVNFTTKDGLNSHSITCLAKGNNGEIYFGNYEKGINVLRNGKIENFRSKINGHSFKTQFLLRYNGKIYAYSRAYLIYVLGNDPNKDIEGYVVNSYLNPPNKRNYLYNLSVFRDNSLKALTTCGVFNVTTDTLTKIDISGLPSTDIICAAERSDGSKILWFQRLCL